MNCFEWQNRSSDYLDGSLIGSRKQEADEHLDSCPACMTRLQHYRTILHAIASQPRGSLPIAIRKSPMTSALPRLDAARLTGSRWERIPWYLRTTIEATSIVLVILAGISAGPKLRAIYEKGIETSFNEFSQSLGDLERDSGSAPAVPLSRGKPVTEGSSPASDEFSSEGDDEEESSAGRSAAQDSEVRVGNSETWRFILKTDSPHEFRPKIVATLTSLKVPSDTPGLGGIEAPGGIQFDLVLAQSVVPGLKKQLQSMAPKPPEELADSPAGETFTWYKNKSKRSVPEGKTRVVIWLSQM